MRRLITVLAAACLLGGVAGTAPAAAAPPTLASGTEIALHVGGFGGHALSYGRRSYRPYGYGYGRSRYGFGRRGHGFLHGLFVGWFLSHLFGGGIPLFPLLLLALALFLFARRRRRRSAPGY